MAKEQKRGNREAKKPKQPKKEAPAAATTLLRGSVTPTSFPKKKG